MCNIERAPIDDSVRPALAPARIVATLNEFGAWSVNLHDNGLVPFDLEWERPRGVTATATALRKHAASIPARASDGRLSPRAINRLLKQIGRWHNANVLHATRHIIPLYRTFAFHGAQDARADVTNWSVT